MAEILRLRNFLAEKRFKILGQIGKGFSSHAYLVENSRGKKFVLKIEREDSPRKEMCKKEVENLKLANAAGIGPKLIDYDFKKRIILMEFIDGQTFSDWLLKSNPKKNQLEKLIKNLFWQAKKLDALGLDHGQLAGKGKNILVRKAGRNFLPVIVDFEKAGTKRKVHNVTQLESFLFRNPNSIIAKRIRAKL